MSIYIQPPSLFPFPHPASTFFPPTIPLLQSCHITIIIITLCLDSGYEQKHKIFVFLNLYYLAQYDDLQFHPFS
jgi:hypothetical protein